MTHRSQAVESGQVSKAKEQVVQKAGGDEKVKKAADLAENQLEKAVGKSGTSQTAAAPAAAAPAEAAVATN